MNMYGKMGHSAVRMQTSCDDMQRYATTRQRYFGSECGAANLLGWGLNQKDIICTAAFLWAQPKAP